MTNFRDLTPDTPPARCGWWITPAVIVGAMLWAAGLAALAGWL